MVKQIIPKILVIDDEKPIRTILQASLEDENFHVQVAENGESGLAVFKSFQPDIILLDIWMPGDYDGIEVLKQIKSFRTKTQIIIMSGHGTIETAVQATKLGAWDFVEKPLSMDKILILISNILQFQKEVSEKKVLLNRLRNNIAIIGESNDVLHMKQMISRIGPTQAWVLISGESGTGKDLIAQNIHYLSSRVGQVFLEVNCSLIPNELIESELFGYEKDYHIGSVSAGIGKFEKAHGGTLFLNEISSLSLEAQATVLRILQEQKFKRLGGTSDIDVDVRVIASTSKDLKEEIRKGNFREDLYYRLNVIPFHISALRDRPVDISNLASHFSSYFAREMGVLEKRFSDKAMFVMRDYVWPGNVRELKNFVERLYILTPGKIIEAQDLSYAGLSFESDNIAIAHVVSFRDARSDFEKNYLSKKIEENNGNITKTAESIGLERSYLHRKIKSYGIEL
ncbi:MAG: sigma-54-dependent Fis family transcriptional regulator [Bdellovibrionaceae bacterium]|jgi:two-component system, NtrC family, nitrogen regulation response regulator NtrX|nr:sigma-54-dependent Fis family transcriptional regulator [Pseudobdellovibrionaceae bacterium]